MKNIMEYKTIDNTIVKAATKENKINDLLVEKANNLIESLPIEKNRNATKYLDYAKENGIKTSDKNSIGRKILQCHLMKYGVSNVWYKAAEKHNVNTKEELYNVYFNQLVEMLKNEIEEIEPIKEEFYSNNKEVEPVAPVEDIKNLKIIYNAIESKINNYIELVDDIEYFNDLIDGIVIYFPTGEAYQIFIDIKNQVNNNNSFIVLDENIMILYNSNDINYIIENVIKSVKEKNDYINNNSDKYMTL